MEKLTELEKVLIERDGSKLEDIREDIKQAREEILSGGNPQDVIEDWFGLEPDYLLDIL